MSLAQQVGKAARVGAVLLVCAIIGKRPRLADVGETQHTFVLAIAEHECTGIAHVAPVGCKHVANATAVTLYVNIVGEFNLVDGYGLTIGKRNFTEIERFFCKAATGVDCRWLSPKAYFATKNVME